LNDADANNRAYRAYLKRRDLDVRMVLPAKTQINGAVLFGRMMQMTRQPNKAVVDLIRELRRSGYRVAALTNNFKDDPTGDMRDSLFDDLFDHFVESSDVGLRKPDPRFYLHACNLLDVRPAETVFLDDIGKNLRAADRLGMAAVQVEIGKETEAVDAVKRILRARGFAPARL
ncbi:hypothetical protein LPJ57_009146, partial [Coemansia sp. RSA 486]